IDHDVDQHEQPGEQQHRTEFVRCDVRVKTVRGHVALFRWRRSFPGVAKRRLQEGLKFQNFTVGAAPRSKKSLRVKPNMPANNAAGICWMPVLYSWTALLKNRRLAAILFSRSDSSLASCWKLALALRSG